MPAPTLQLSKTVPQLLQEKPQQRFKARELALMIFERYPEACRAKMEKSAALKNDDDLIQQIVAEIGAQRPKIQAKYPEVRVTESRPRRFFWSDKSLESEVEDAEADRSPLPVAPVIATIKPELVESSLSEHDLYPLLGDNLSTEFSVDVMRIDERRSSNKRGYNGNRWLYPDVVGVEDLTKGWNDELKLCVTQTGDPRARLWSAEVKRLINRSNVRESYFQAVSNSSWSNIAYLVTAEIEGTDTMQELRMLYALHGVGLIQLDTENPSESQVIIPARKKPRLTGRRATDWSMKTATSNFSSNESGNSIKPEIVSLDGRSGANWWPDGADQLKSTELRSRNAPEDCNTERTGPNDVTGVGCR